MSKKKVPNRKLILKKLSNLCIKHFGKDFESWSWQLNATYEPQVIKAAIELSKTTIDGKLKYTDPFLATSTGETKALIIAAENAVR